MLVRLSLVGYRVQHQIVLRPAVAELQPRHVVHESLIDVDRSRAMPDERHGLWRDAALEEPIANLVATVLIGESDGKIVFVVQPVVNLHAVRRRDVRGYAPLPKIGQQCRMAQRLHFHVRELRHRRLWLILWRL